MTHWQFMTIETRCTLTGSGKGGVASYANPAAEQKAANGVMV